MHIKFRLQNLKGGYYLEDIDVGGFILKWILKQKWCEVVAQVRAQWQAPVNTVVNFHVL